MSITLPRKKKRNLKLSFFYRVSRFLDLFLSSTTKMKLFLDLSWIFSRLAHEEHTKSGLNLSVNNEEPNFLINKISKNQRVLDIGCGTGNVILKLLPYTENIVGIDHNQVSLNVIKQKINNPTIKLICGDIFNYMNENPSEHFDVIILSHILEHLDNPKEFLNNVLSFGDFFYVEVPDFNSSHLNLLRKHLDTDLIYTDNDHVTEFDRKEIQTIFKDLNLNILDTEYIEGVMKYWLRKK
ncbi:MAG: class I SAM-dependent methyltransferase [Chitinophagales bacterium]